MTKQQINDATEIGTAWGQQEVSLWEDQNEGVDKSRMTDWVYGTYAGDLSEFRARAQAAEKIIDNAAAAVWDAARLA